MADNLNIHGVNHIKIKRNTTKPSDNNLEKIMGLKKIKIDAN